MAPPDPPRPDPDTPPVPELVNDYRAQLDAIRTQARDLARMRAEVLSAADRESQAIVTGARSEIREILVKARRELLVLAAQVQAVTEQDVPKELGPGEEAAAPGRGTALMGARQEVRHVLSEARPDLDALSVEAKVLRANLLALRTPEHTSPRAASASPAPPDIDLPPAQPASTPVPESSEPIEEPGPEPEDPAAALDAFADDEKPRVFGAEPATQTDDDPVGVRPTRSTSPIIRGFDTPPRHAPSAGRAFVGAFAALALIVVAGTSWWLYSQRGSGGVETATTRRTSAASPAQSRPAAPSAPAPVTPPASQAQPAGPAEPTLIIEARSESWIRAQIDGRPDAGRVYQAGETRTITGAARVSVRAGDAGAVYVALNGATPEPLGPAGRPLTRDFILVDTPSDPPAPAPPAAEPPAAPAPEPPAARESIPPALSAPRATTTPVPAAPAQSAAAPTPQRVASVPEPPQVPQASAAPVEVAATAEDELVGLSRRWLDAYLSGNSNTMLAVSGGTPEVRDQRPPSERATPTGPAARRVFEAPRLQRGADIGIFSVRMTERPTAATEPERVALVSQVWMRRTGKWQLIDVRIVSESQIKNLP